jgi:hypothetical protein
MRGMTTFSLINIHAFLHVSITRRPTTHVRWIFTDSILSRWHASRRRSIKVVDTTPTNSAVHYPKYQNRTTYLRRPNSIAGTVPLRAMCLLIDLNTTTDPKSSRCYLRRADRSRAQHPLSTLSLTVQVLPILYVLPQNHSSDRTRLTTEST